MITKQLIFENIFDKNSNVLIIISNNRLRALSSDGGPNSCSSAPPTTSSTPKYKLAEYRYGREEMLALFNPHIIKPPENVEEFPHLFVDKVQMPLSLLTMTEEESRLWTRVNSDAVLRLVGKGGSAPERGERPISERGGISMRAGRGGGLSERGRGRGRGYYQRNNFEDNGDSPPERRDFRNKTFERNHTLNDENSRDRKFDRSFTRGGGNGGTEDRDLLSRKNNSRSSSVENWRTGGRGEDREGWRTARGPTDNWNRSNSWRSGERDKDFDPEMEASERNGPHRKYYQRDRNPNDLWDDIDDNDRRNSLPEWSLEDGSEIDAKVGTFDDSGAFREDTNEDDDEEEPKSDEESAVAQKEDKTEFNSKNNNQMNKSEKDSENELKLRKSSEMSVRSEDKSMNKRQSNERQIQMKAQTSQKDSQSVPESQSSQTPSNKLLNKSLNSNQNLNSQQIKSPLEEDGFSHLEKEAENMVAQWTADDDSKDKPEAPTFSHESHVSNNIVVVPVTHEDALKWYYRDPQNEVQGPFTPHEMYDWFTAGYFAMDLLVRRGCDEYFAQLGELFKLWERIPFIHVQGSTPPPLRIQSSNPSHPSLSINSSTSHPSVHPLTATPPQHVLNPQLTSHPPQPPHSVPAQLHQQMFVNQQSVDMQSQLRLLLAQLKKQEGFSDLSQQQQQEVLVQRYVHLEQQRQQSLQTSIPNNRNPEESQISSLEALSNLRIQSNRPPVQQMMAKGGHVHSIWDITGNSNALSVRDIEEMQRKEQEMKELEERRKAFEDEQNRKKLEQEDLQRKIAEERERKFEELQKKLEEERLRNQELLRKQEEEKRRREEEERMRIEEEDRIRNERVAEEQKRRHEELMRLEEYARLQSLQEEDRRRQIEVEKERQRQQLQEIERERQKEMERIRQIQQQEAIIKLQQQQEKKRQGPVWGQPEIPQKQHNSLSLDDIQRLQEEKDREERQKQMQQKHMQALLAAQQQQQQNKQALTWAAQTYQQTAPVKTLAEIQREEAEKVAKQRVIENKKQLTQVTNSVPNAGIWNNATNQLFANKQPPPTKAVNSSANNASAPIGFWEPESRKVSTNRANESALNSMQTISKGNNSTQFVTKTNSKNKKEEVFTILYLFKIKFLMSVHSFRRQL